MGYVYGANNIDKMHEEGNIIEHLDADLIAYSHGQYYTLGENIGKFGYSVQKKRK